MLYVFCRPNIAFDVEKSENKLLSDESVASVLSSSAASTDAKKFFSEIKAQNQDSKLPQQQKPKHQR